MPIYAGFLLIFFALILYWMSIYIDNKQRAKNKEKEKDKNNVEYLQQNAGTLKQVKTELDYWYEKPHWYVLPNGKKINLSEYMTYEEYKSYSKPQLVQFVSELSTRLKDENNEDKEIIL